MTRQQRAWLIGFVYGMAIGVLLVRLPFIYTLGVFALTGIERWAQNRWGR